MSRVRRRLGSPPSRLGALPLPSLPSTARGSISSRGSFPSWRVRCSAIRVSSKHELKERLMAFIDDINREPVVRRRKSIFPLVHCGERRRAMLSGHPLSRVYERGKPASGRIGKGGLSATSTAVVRCRRRSGWPLPAVGADVTTCRGPRTEPAGLTGTTWPVTSQ
jgi:hypothetical protein